LPQPYPQEELFPADLPANSPEMGGSLGKFPLTLLGGPSGLRISFCATHSVGLEQTSNRREFLKAKIGIIRL
jgi:hypothetical protein